jgi:cytoskeletal protein CcmA (bactofilin family)
MTTSILMNDITEFSHTNTSSDLIVGKGVRFSGSAVIPDRVVINGIFDGELTAGELIVEIDGEVSGTIIANHVDVKGVLRSTVTCSNLLTIHATGFIEGTMEYGELSIERGGKFAGQMKQR